MKKGLELFLLLGLVLVQTGCDRPTPSGAAGLEVLEVTKPPPGFQIDAQLWEGNSYNTPDFRYWGPSTEITPHSITPPDGYQMKASLGPKKAWSEGWSRLATWQGPVLDGEGTCELRLEIPERGWETRTTRLIKLVANCDVPQND